MTEDERVEAAIQFHTDVALKRHQQTHPAMVSQSAEFCYTCGNEIPEQRRAALPGVTLCIECKRAEELNQRTYL